MVNSKFPLPSLNRERYRVLWYCSTIIESWIANFANPCSTSHWHADSPLCNIYMHEYFHWIRRLYMYTRSPNYNSLFPETSQNVFTHWRTLRNHDHHYSYTIQTLTMCSKTGRSNFYTGTVALSFLTKLLLGLLPKAELSNLLASKLLHMLYIQLHP